MIAGPSGDPLRAPPGALEMAHDVAVRIEDADRGNRPIARPFCRRASRSRFSGVNAEGEFLAASL